MVKPRENRVPIMMSDDELAAIDDWRFENRIGTRSDAVRRLVQMGLRLDRHFDFLHDRIRDVRGVAPMVADEINKSVNAKKDGAYDTQALLSVVLGFINLTENHEELIKVLYGILAETAALKDEQATAEAIRAADDGAAKHYSEIEKALKPLVARWGDQ
ncbi:hypothetical protein ACLBWZ_16265 [Brucellaceae bacterium C25G]